MSISQLHDILNYLRLCLLGYDMLCKHIIALYLYYPQDRQLFVITFNVESSVTTFAFLFANFFLLIK